MLSLPVSPKASAAVEVMTTREPTFLPGSSLLNDGKSCAAPRSRPTEPVSQVELTTLPSRPLTMTAWIVTRSSLATAAPVPSVTTCEPVLVTVSGALTETVGRLGGVAAGDGDPTGRRGRLGGRLLAAGAQDERGGEDGGGQGGGEAT